MVIVLSIIASLGLALGAAWVLGSPRQQPDRAAEACWRNFADRLDLNYDPGGLLKGPMITGTISGMNLQMDTLYQVREGRKTVVTRVTLYNDNLPEGLDKSSKAKASDDPVKRMLASITRRYITELIKKIGATVAGKKVRWIRENAVWPPESTADVIRRIGQICEFLCLDEDNIPTRLLHGYHDETLSDNYRDEIKQLLFTQFADSEECETVAGDMLEDPDPRSRLTAARTLGPRGFEALAKIAKAPDVPKDVREAALGDLISKTEASSGLKLLGSVINSPHIEVSRSALGMVRRHRYTPAIRLLLDIARDSTAPSDKICNIVDIIGEIGDSSAQQTLLSLLQHDFVMVRRRAATALGRIGTQSAIPALQQCMSTASSNKRFKDLCKRAIDKIRQRHNVHGENQTAEAV